MPEHLRRINPPLRQNCWQWVGIMLLIIEAVCITLFIEGIVSWLQCLSLHIILIIIGGYLVYRFHQQGGNILLPLFWLMMGAIFGVIAAGILLVSSVLCHFFYPSSPKEEEGEEALGGESNSIYERIIFGLERVQQTSDIEPFNDILAYGNLKQKQTVLMKIMRHFRPAFAPLLRYALHDKEMAIRVQAATIIANIERHFMTCYMQLEKTLHDCPENSDELLAFANLCNAYVDSGLLDEDSAHKSRQKAIILYEHYVTCHPHDIAIKMQLARSYLQAKAFMKAALLFRQCIDEVGLNSPELTLWYIEALSALQSYGKIRNLADAHSLKFNRYNATINTEEIVSMFHNWRDGIPLSHMKIGQ